MLEAKRAKMKDTTGALLNFGTALALFLSRTKQKEKNRANTKTPILLKALSHGNATSKPLPRQPCWSVTLSQNPSRG